MDGKPDQGWAIPRFHRIGYLEVVLLEVSQKASFERIRQVLLQYTEQAGENQVSPGTGSRLMDEYTFWSPTQEALSELMHLGFLVQASVPSARQYVDSHRASTYELTPLGMAAADELRKRDPKARAAFLDKLTAAVVKAHPGFADLVEAAGEYPICIPEYTLESINRFIAIGNASQGLSEDALRRIMKHWPDTKDKPSVNDLNICITDALNRRFPECRAGKPSQKDLLDTINDALVSFVAKSRNIRLDAISFNVCMSWGAQLAILEQSRYVEDWPGRTIWTTYKIENSSVVRRGFKEATAEIIAGLVTGFKNVAAAMPDSRASGFLPIYRVRAQAAFKARVNLRLVDIVISKILSDELTAPYKIQVALGRATPPPPSEPIFTFQTRRFFDILITDKEEIK
jgi:hypothetical protein